MPPRVLIVDNSVHPLLFKPHWHWRTHLRRVSVRSVNVPSGRAVPSLSGFTHIILTGSEASILDPKPWFDVEADLIHRAVDAGIPTLGSCFGHQMLVYALSGPDWLRPSNPPEIGWAEIERMASDPLFDDLPNPWRTFVYHFDEVADPPPPWLRLGRTEHCDTHLLRYGEAPVWGIQAHPEISSRKAKLFIQLSVVLGKKPLRHVLPMIRHVPARDAVIDPILRRFLRWERRDSETTPLPTNCEDKDG